MSPAIRTTHENVRAAQVLLGQCRRHYDKWQRFIDSMAGRPLTRPEARIK